MLPLDTKNTLAARIKKLRKDKGLSQAKLAKIIGVSPGNLGDWERAHSTPGAKALIALTDFFEVSTDWILKGEDTGEFSGISLPGEQIKKLLKLLLDVSADEREELILLMDCNVQYLARRKYLQSPGIVFQESVLTASEEQGPYFPVDSFESKLLIVEVTSDHMTEAGFNEGDLIAIDTKAEVGDGEVGLFKLNGKIILQKKQFIDQKIHLTSANKKYCPIPIDKIDNLLLLGKCVKHIPKIEEKVGIWRADNNDNLIK